MFEHEFPVILGRDFAGVVERAATGQPLPLGDEVFGFVPHADPAVHAGSWAELIVPSGGQVTPPPRRRASTPRPPAPHPVAALNPIAAFDVAPAAGEDVLVVGATGGIGTSFVQLAASVGANVIAPPCPRTSSTFRDLGVSEILDRQRRPRRRSARGASGRRQRPLRRRLASTRCLPCSGR